MPALMGIESVRHSGSASMGVEASPCSYYDSFAGELYDVVFSKVVLSMYWPDMTMPKAPKWRVINYIEGSKTYII